VIGFDVSQVAVDVAAPAAAECLGTGQYEYRRGSFIATGLPDACADENPRTDAIRPGLAYYTGYGSAVVV
jgi:hypothetical protein